ncbi:MAG: AAA family ATPase [Thermoleophilia bacterium]|nr:AAA family ATPase [Thermoleophilia bacterium]
MAELPVGTVTFLFTDIEGSTTRLKELGVEVYSDLLVRHGELLGRAIAAHGGVEVESLGDGVFAVFADATAAIAAVAEAQRALAVETWPGRKPVGVRMGLHTGEALVRGPNYVGYAVHHAARIGDMGHGGQVLLSGPTADLVAHDLPEGVRLRSLGTVAIADADGPQPLYQLEIDGLRTDFPRLRTRQRRVLAASPDRVLERTSELATLSELVEAAAAGSGRFAVVLGEAGIGKTTLVRELRHAAEAHAMDVLQARGGELEHEFSYGIARQLFEARIAGATPDARSRLVAGSAALAAHLFEETAVPTGGAGPVDTSFAALHGLFWLTANLAEQRSLLLLIDDLHWADEPSLRWLGYLVRRLEGLPVLVAVAMRPPHQGFEQELLAELVADPATHRVLPKTLSREAVEALVRSTLSADADEVFSAACHEATGGNPLLLRGLLDALAQEHVPPRAEHVGAVMEIGPKAVSHAVDLRLSRLPSEAAALARAVAVLGDDADLGAAAELASLDREVAAYAATLLERTALVRFNVTLGFVHPVVRAALNAQLTPPERERAHALAAEALAGRARPERVAAHLLQTPPTGADFAVDALSSAADGSLRRGDPRGAARYLRRALEEEPADKTLRCDLLYRLGRAERLLTSPAAAEPLRQARELADGPERRGEIALELGTALFYGQQVEEAIGVLESAIAELDATHWELRRVLEGALLSVTSIFPPLYPIALAQIERLPEVGLEGDVGSRMIDAILSYDDARRLAPCDDAIARARRALAGGPLYSEDNAAFVFAAYTLVLADRFDEAESVWDQAWADAQARGSISGYAIVSTFRAFLELHTGRLDESLTDARNGLAACQEYGLVTAIPYAVGHIADAALELGDVATAQAAVDGLDAAADGSHLVWPFLDSRGRTRIAAGDPAWGLEDVLAAGQQYEAMRGRNPALFPWRTTAALAHLELGDRDEAARLAHEEVALAREWGRPRALGHALRVAGVVSEDSALLREAVEVLDGSPARLARAKALADLGAALAAAGEADAGEILLEALRLARALRAAPVAARAETGLRALGADVPPEPVTGLDALAAPERRIAGLVSQGLGVDEIAQKLFLTPATVEDYVERARARLGEAVPAAG